MNEQVTLTKEEIEELLEAIKNPKPMKLTAELVIIENEFALARRFRLSQDIEDLV